MSSAQIADEYAPEHVRAQDVGRLLAEITTEPEWGLTTETWSDSQARWRVHLSDEPDIVTDGGVAVVRVADELVPMRAVLRVFRGGHPGFDIVGIRSTKPCPFQPFRVVTSSITNYC